MIVTWRGDQDRIRMMEVTKATPNKVSLVILTISSLSPAKSAVTEAPYQCSKFHTVSPEEGTRAFSVEGRR